LSSAVWIRTCCWLEAQSCTWSNCMPRMCPLAYHSLHLWCLNTPKAEHGKAGPTRDFNDGAEGFEIDEGKVIGFEQMFLLKACYAGVESSKMCDPITCLFGVHSLTVPILIMPQHCRAVARNHCCAAFGV
jgi:hypothetical protein